MEEIILITSATNDYKKNYRYLTHGCLTLSDSKNLEKVIINHPWDNYESCQKDFKKINSIYSFVLEKLSNTLNEYFKIKKDLRFWKILIGPWLHSFIVAYYEKNLLIDILLKYESKIKIPIVEYKIEDFIPKDYITFWDKQLRHSDWHDYIFSSIIREKNLNTNFFLSKKTDKLIKKKFVRKIIQKNYIFSLIKLILIKTSNFLLYYRLKTQSIIFFNTYLGFKNNLFLLFKNFSIPFFFKEEKNNSKPNMTLRRSLSNYSVSENSFYDKIYKKAILNIPTDFLENFLEIKKKIFNSKVTKNPSVIFTSNGILPHSNQTRYIAECVSNGCKLIIAQHGGRYGHHKMYFNDVYEIDISNYYISWGWKKDNSKIRNLGIIKPFNKMLRKSGDKKKRKNILYLMTSKGRFNRSIDFEINLKNLYSYFSQTCPNFYSKINDKLKKNIVFRSSKVNFWNEKEYLQQFCKEAKIDFNQEQTNLFKAVNNSKIVVCSYLSTTFLEVISANAPVILFSPYSHENFNSETLDLLNQMEKCDIFFKRHDEAAYFINNNWNTIDSWWWSEKVQKCRAKFVENFSKINPNLIKDIQSLIKEIKYQVNTK